MDLVDRLRAAAHDDYEGDEPIHSLLVEAVEEIEGLQGKIVAAEELFRVAEDMIEKYKRKLETELERLERRER